MAPDVRSPPIFFFCVSHSLYPNSSDALCLRCKLAYGSAVIPPSVAPNSVIRPKYKAEVWLRAWSQEMGKALDFKARVRDLGFLGLRVRPDKSQV